jgi:hypothetical protein
MHADRTQAWFAPADGPLWQVLLFDTAYLLGRNAARARAARRWRLEHHVAAITAPSGSASPAPCIALSPPRPGSARIPICAPPLPDEARTARSMRFRHTAARRRRCL